MASCCVWSWQGRALRDRWPRSPQHRASLTAPSAPRELGPWDSHSWCKGMRPRPGQHCPATPSPSCLHAPTPAPPCPQPPPPAEWAQGSGAGTFRCGVSRTWPSWEPGEGGHEGKRRWNPQGQLSDFSVAWLEEGEEVGAGSPHLHPPTHPYPYPHPHSCSNAEKASGAESS